MHLGDVIEHVTEGGFSVSFGSFVPRHQALNFPEKRKEKEEKGENPKRRKAKKSDKKSSQNRGIEGVESDHF